MPSTCGQLIFWQRAREVMMVLKAHFFWAYSQLAAAPVE